MMRNRFAALAAAVAFLGTLGIAAAEMKGHEGMHGSSGGSTGDHGAMTAGDHGKTGDRIFAGKVGPWKGEARLVDMKAQMEKMKGSGMKMEGTMKSHHFMLALTDPKTGKAPAGAKGTIAVTGPDKKETVTDLMSMEGHLGADVDLPAPGKYTFKATVDAGGKKGTATFSRTVK